MATRVIDDTKLQNIAVAIQGKDNGGQMTVDEMPGRIQAIPSGGNTLDEYFANTLEVVNIPSATEIPSGFFLNKSKLINITMPNVTSIGGNAFRMCTSLALTSLPNEITSIGGNAFQSCGNLALTSLPNGITSISPYTFFGCGNLALTSLPNGITGIGDYAFSWCTNIPYLDFSGFTQIPTLGAHAFDSTTFPLYFRDQQQIDEWAAATNWSTYANRFQIKPSGVI